MNHALIEVDTVYNLLHFNIVSLSFAQNYTLKLRNKFHEMNLIRQFEVDSVYLLHSEIVSFRLMRKTMP